MSAIGSVMVMSLRDLLSRSGFRQDLFRQSSWGLELPASASRL
jgi:hypothetical protein